STGFSQPQQTNIIVKNITENIEHFQFIFRDLNQNGIFENGDAVFFAFGDSLGKRAERFADVKVSWSVTFVEDTTLPIDQRIAPKPGDIFKVATKKPFRTGEYF